MVLLVTDPGRVDRDIVNDSTRQRLVLEQHGLTSELIYRVRGDGLVIVHTEVPEELGGRGIGGQLVHAAIELARDMGLGIAPWCPFARRWLKGHPEAAAGVEIDWKLPVAGQIPGNSSSSEAST
jgi:predicted GNAT family acetyltransferase